MPFTHAPVIVELTKALAEDLKALSQLTMDRTTASYKTTHGLAESFKEKLVKNLQQCPFSMNIDESTSNNNKRVLAVLVSFYDKQSEMVVCEHWKSIELIKVDAASIYSVIVELIESNDVPWSNLVSILMDSCSVMRGKKSGVETRIRNEKAPHLLDVDGDSCHHIHNSCKKFCDPFEKYLEYLFIDIHNDFKWSSDQKELLSEVCELLEMKYTTPERFLEHRWLSAYDLAVSTDILMDAFQVVYHSLSKEDKTLYFHKVTEICQRRTVSKEARDRLREIRTELSKKNMTELGKKRKKRIIEKLFWTEQKTRLYLSFYQEVMPIMKSYILTFQTNDVMVHQLHERQLETFKNFLACFVKAEHLINKSAKKLQELDLSEDKGQFMNIKDMFVGSKIRKMMKEIPKNDSVLNDFLKRASAAYISCATHMQKKLPLNSKVLKSLSCLDPFIRSHSMGVRGLNRLSEYLSHMLSEEEESSILKEITSFSVDGHMPEPCDDVVQWWTQVSKANTYPALCKVAMGAFSIFHGPLVESSFNVMGDVIGVKSASMNIETYSSVQTIKYGFRARKTTALKMFRRRDPKFSPVDRHVCIKLRSAAARYKKKKDVIRAQKLARLQRFSVSNNVKSKTVLKKNSLETQERSYTKHLELEAKRAKKRIMTEKLNHLCAKKRKT